MKFITDTFNNHRIGLLALRTFLAVALLLHGYSKLINGIDPIIGMVTAHGLPAFFAYFVYVGEVLAPAAMLVGVLVKPAAWIVAINMVVAVLLAHMGQLASLGKTGGWALELQGFYFVAAVTVAMTDHLSRVEWMPGRG